MSKRPIGLSRSTSTLRSIFPSSRLADTFRRFKTLHLATQIEWIIHIAGNIYRYIWNITRTYLLTDKSEESSNFRYVGFVCIDAQRPHTKEGRRWKAALCISTFVLSILWARTNSKRYHSVECRKLDLEISSFVPWVSHTCFYWSTSLPQ